MKFPFHETGRAKVRMGYYLLWAPVSSRDPFDFFVERSKEDIKMYLGEYHELLITPKEWKKKTTWQKVEKSRGSLFS